MDNKSISSDVGCISIYAPSSALPAEVKLRKPNYDLRWRSIAPRKGDLTGYIPLGLFPSLIIKSTEASTLEVTIILANLQPGTAGRMENGITPCVKMDFNGLFEKNLFLFNLYFNSKFVLINLSCLGILIFN